VTGKYPSWSEWELLLSSHALKRMEQRGLSEIDLRTMLHSASAYTMTMQRDRWLAHCNFQGTKWLVVLEPIHDLELITVVTVFPVE